MEENKKRGKERLFIKLYLKDYADVKTSGGQGKFPVSDPLGNV